MDEAILEVVKLMMIVLLLFLQKQSLVCQRPP
jgi:hypothetical protein